LGHGVRATNERQALWVLTRQKLSMSAWPRWNDRIRIETWVRPSEGPFAIRDFAVFDASGSLIGESSTSWARLDIKTHKPIREPLTDFPAGTGRSSFDAEKIAPRASELMTLARFEVRNSDIDGNQHVNNTRYAQWILDAIPIEAHSQYVLDEYGVNFLSETRLGDVVEIQSAPDVGYYHGQRVSDRKIVFTAHVKSRLHSTPES
jgi:medium-chain acyl-[acyl-carrier-protein] hydrolase